MTSNPTTEKHDQDAKVHEDLGRASVTRRKIRPRSDTTEWTVAISDGPKCPKSHTEGFDDWWHDPSVRASGGIMRGRLRCHGCGRFFSVTFYHGGETHSAMRIRA